MGYFQPLVIYRNYKDDRSHSIIRYIGNRINSQNKNFLCAVVGQTGAGKSYASLGMAELYANMFGKVFDPEVHVISSLKELLLLITAKDVDKKIGFGSVIVFDEPQIEANAREWQSEMNKALNQLISTFRNQRLCIFFAVPYLTMIDKQSRILFHAEFKVNGYDRATGMSHLKPRFLEYIQEKETFYKKRLIIYYKTAEERKMSIIKLQNWDVPKASDNIINIYEQKKKAFTDVLNKKLLNKINLSESQSEGKNKANDFLKVKDLYDKYGENYLEISKQMPHIPIFTLNKFVLFIKKSLNQPMKKAGEPYKVARGWKS